MQPTFTSNSALSFVCKAFCYSLSLAHLPPQCMEPETPENRRKKREHMRFTWTGYPCNLATKQPSPEPPAGSFAVCKLFMVLRQEEVA